MSKRKQKKNRSSFKSKHKKHHKKAVKLKHEEPDELKRAPHSFIIHRGTVGKYILELEKDFRKVMDPFTASNLQVQKKNTIKDFVSVSSVMKVSHLIIFTNSEIGPYLRIARLPQGPTLMFKIHNYSLGRDVLSSLKKQMTNKKLFTNAPLAILNNFTGDGSHIKLMASVFQNMFPTINITKVQLSDIRRCVMLNYNSETKLIDFRHYAIKAVPIGISRGVKKIVQSKIPNLAKYEDISEFLMKPSMVSESEIEDDPTSHVEVPQKLPARGNIVSQQSSIRLSELGPRLTLQLIKVEEGLLTGEVMYHSLITKTEDEKRVIRKRITEKRRLKEQRRMEQEKNVKIKEELKELHKQKSLDGIKRKQMEEDNQEMDDDNNYFKEEVGHDPDEGVFSETKPPKKVFGFRTKRKRESDDEPEKKKTKPSYKFVSKKDGKSDKPFKKSKKFSRDESKSKFRDKINKFNKKTANRDESKSKCRDKMKKFNKKPAKFVARIRSKMSIKSNKRKGKRTKK